MAYPLKNIQTSCMHSEFEIGKYYTVREVFVIMRTYLHDDLDDMVTYAGIPLICRGDLRMSSRSEKDR